MPGALPKACQGATHRMSAEGTSNRALGTVGPKPRNFPAQSSAKDQDIIEVDLRATSETVNLPTGDVAPPYSGPRAA